AGADTGQRRLRTRRDGPRGTLEAAADGSRRALDAGADGAEDGSNRAVRAQKGRPPHAMIPPRVGHHRMLYPLDDCAVTGAVACSIWSPGDMPAVNKFMRLPEACMGRL